MRQILAGLALAALAATVSELRHVLLALDASATALH